MQKNLIAVAVAGALSLPTLVFAADAAPASPHSFTGNVGVVTDYLFRGISQTAGTPAIQGGVDYAHTSGLYAGLWASHITWVQDQYATGSLEVDGYFGFKNTFAGDWSYDLGLIRYAYPGAGSAILNTSAPPHTSEAYLGLGYKWVSLKYSQTVSGHFAGFMGGAALDKETKGTNYLELNANYDLGDGLGINGHVGSLRVKNSVTTTGGVLDASYTDWKLGVTKDVGWGVFGLAYSTTNAKGTCPKDGAGATSSFCFGTAGAVNGVNGATRNFNNVARGTFLGTFLKSF